MDPDIYYLRAFLLVEPVLHAAGTPHNFGGATRETRGHRGGRGHARRTTISRDHAAFYRRGGGRARVSVASF